MNNYRPISLICTLSKVLESVVKDELTSFFNRKGIIPNCQHGFRSQKSVNGQLLECTHDWSKALGNHLFIDIVYFDFEKAFDSVPHNLLLQKLHKYGFVVAF